VAGQQFQIDRLLIALEIQQNEPALILRVS